MNPWLGCFLDNTGFLHAWASISCRYESISYLDRPLYMKKKVSSLEGLLVSCILIVFVLGFIYQFVVLLFSCTVRLFYGLSHSFVVRPPSQYKDPDSKVHGANMWLIWGRQDPGGPHVGPMAPNWPHVGPMNLAIWVWVFIMGTPILVRRKLFIETAPRIVLLHFGRVLLYLTLALSENKFSSCQSSLH